MYCRRGNTLRVCKQADNKLCLHCLSLVIRNLLPGSADRAGVALLQTDKNVALMGCTRPNHSLIVSKLIGNTSSVN